MSRLIVVPPRDLIAATSSSGAEVFLLGGITNTWDWQGYTGERLLAGAAEIPMPLTVFNPRRRDFNPAQPGVDEEQGDWEFDHLHRPGVITTAWFDEADPSVVMPASMFEFGMALGEGRDRLVVGIHPRFARAAYLRHQLSRVAPWLTIHDFLDGTIEATLRLAYQVHTKTPPDRTGSEENEMLIFGREKQQPGLRGAPVITPKQRVERMRRNKKNGKLRLKKK